jgi:hypothetical protein
MSCNCTACRGGYEDNEATHAIELSLASILSNRGELAGPYLPTPDARVASTSPYLPGSFFVQTASPYTPGEEPKAESSPSPSPSCCVKKSPEFRDSGNISGGKKVDDFTRGEPQNRALRGQTTLGEHGDVILVELSCGTSKANCKDCKVKQTGKLLGIESRDINNEIRRGPGQGGHTYNPAFLKKLRETTRNPNLKAGDSFDDPTEGKVLCINGTLTLVDAPRITDIGWGTIEFTTEFISEDDPTCDYSKCVIIWRYTHVGSQLNQATGGRAKTKVEKRKVYCVRKQKDKDGKEIQEVIFDAESTRL